MKKLISKKDEKCYAFILKIIKSIQKVNSKYNWLISAIEAYPFDVYGKMEKMLQDNEYLFLSTNELINMLEKNDFQWIWAVFSAIPNNYTIKDILKYKIPYIEDNKKIFTDTIIQHPLADIEMVVEDGTSLSIVAKENKYLDVFKEIYPLAEDYTIYLNDKN